MITHTVLITFAEPTDVDEGKRRLEALTPQIDELLSLWVGLDVLHTESSYDLVLVTTHHDLDGLLAYQAHPVHQEFLAWLKPRLAARAVVDAES